MMLCSVEVGMVIGAGEAFMGNSWDEMLLPTLIKTVTVQFSETLSLPWIVNCKHERR